MRFFQTAIDRLVQVGMNPTEAKALVNTIRSAEDYHVATKLQQDVNERIKPDGSLGSKVARVLKYEDIGFLIHEASLNAPSPNQVPSAISAEAAILSAEMLKLQSDFAPLKEDSAFMISHLTKLGKLTDGIKI